MSVAEANLFLQDILWQETRGDQRRISRWFAWARLRRPWWGFKLPKSVGRWCLFIAYTVMVLLGLMVCGLYGLFYLSGS
jgi:hypothetical protein